MNSQEQIKACAELDGWNSLGQDAEMVEHWIQFPRDVISCLSHEEIRKQRVWSLPKYLTSYDAIIPLIQKQSEHIKTQLADFLGEIALPDYDGTDEFHYSVLHYLICAKPAQLCEALLRATGKWND